MSRIIARDILIEFPIYGVQQRSLKKVVLNAATGGRIARDANERPMVRALNGVSFDCRDGDRLGVVGHNGSGKSTLLRVIAGAYEPVSGSIEVEGRVSSMLSITLGMDQESTGYENIILRGLLMGLRRREIAQLAEEIADFSGLGAYIDMPLRTYSSGMAMRLAFAIATCISADIILMDEWLSVGDQSFAEKAQARLKKLVKDAKILVLASHNETFVTSLCNKVLRLKNGEAEPVEDLSREHSIAVADRPSRSLTIGEGEAAHALPAYLS